MGEEGEHCNRALPRTTPRVVHCTVHSPCTGTNTLVFEYNVVSSLNFIRIPNLSFEKGILFILFQSLRHPPSSSSLKLNDIIDETKSLLEKTFHSRKDQAMNLNVAQEIAACPSLECPVYVSESLHR